MKEWAGTIEKKRVCLTPRESKYSGLLETGILQNHRIPVKGCRPRECRLRGRDMEIIKFR